MAGLNTGLKHSTFLKARREEISEDLRMHTDKARAEVKVDSRGNAALERLRIENRVYE